MPKPSIGADARLHDFRVAWCLCPGATGNHPALNIRVAVEIEVTAQFRGDLLWLLVRNQADVHIANNTLRQRERRTSGSDIPAIEPVDVEGGREEIPLQQRHAVEVVDEALYPARTRGIRDDGPHIDASEPVADVSEQSEVFRVGWAHVIEEPIHTDCPAIRLGQCRYRMDESPRRAVDDRL